MFNKTKTAVLISALTLGSAMVATPAIAQDTSGQTQNPVVLVHGLAGFDTILVDYFYGVKNSLASVGANKVYTPQLSAVNTSEVRGEQLVEYLEDLQAATGATKFNLIGHSQGGIDSRYAAAVRPDLVASVTSVGSPHLGSATADFIKDTPLEDVTDAIGGAIGTLIAILGGDASLEQSAMGSMEALNSTDAAKFNAKYPQALRSSSCRSVPLINVGAWYWPEYAHDYSVNDGAHQVNGVQYYSWTGTYSPIINSNPLDVGDAMLAITAIPFGFEKNDGLVGRCSSHMGQVIRDDYTMNHIDEVNQIFGLGGLFTTDPVPLYREHVRRLKNAGL
ncbi:MAG: triacylglycerol lipase [Alteromonadaceae bacterium]|jgi:triacylglycerol lipase